MKDKFAPIDNCPHCGSDEGFYTKVQVSGTTRYCYNYDGSEAENSELYESCSHKGGKYAYCLKCGKRLFKMPG